MIVFQGQAYAGRYLNAATAALLDDDKQCDPSFEEDRSLNVGQWPFHLVYENAEFVKAALQTAVRC